MIHMYLGWLCIIYVYMKKNLNFKSGMMIFCKTKPLCSNISVTCRCLLQGQLSELNIDRINRSKSHHALDRPFARLSDLRQRTPLNLCPQITCAFSLTNYFLNLEKIQQINKMFPTSCEINILFQFFTHSRWRPPPFSKGRQLRNSENTLTKFKNLLPQKHWTNLNQTLHNANLSDGVSSLFKWRTPPFSKVQIHWANFNQILGWRGFKFVQMKNHSILIN